MKYESQLQITTAAAVPPLTVNQTALVTNFNADLLDGQHGAYYATAASLGGYLPLTGGTLTGTLTGTVGIFTTLRASELTSLLGSNGPITITPDGTGHVHINSTDIRLGPNNTNATLATRGTGDLILRTNEGSAVEGSIRIYDGANGNIEITPNGTGTVVVGKLSGSTASFSGQITSTVATGTAPLVITSTTAVTNLNADLLDGQHGSYYQNAGNLNAGTVPLARLSGSYNIDITGSSAFVFVNDTRSSVTGPQTGYRQVRADFLNNSTDGLSDGGTYHGVLTFQQWADSSGGGTRQLAFTDNDNLWIRGSGTGLTSYNPWKLVLNSVNYSTYALPLSGGTLTGQLFSNSKIETTGVVTGSSFSGAGTGLTGTAASLTAGAVPWTGVTGKPTTLSGYGITDALPLTGGTLTGGLSGTTASFSGAVSAPQYAWASSKGYETSNSEYSGPRTLFELAYALAQAHGSNDAFRYKTVLNRQSWNGSAWVTDNSTAWTNTLTPDGGGTTVITQAEYAAGTTRKRFTIDVGGDWQRANLIFVQRGWNQSDWAFSLEVERSTDNVNWTSDGVQSVPNGPGLAYFSQADTGQARWFRITVAATQVITAGGLTIIRVMALGPRYATVHPFTVDYSRNVSFAAGITIANPITSTVATGTAPLVITSTTAVTNLNSDLLDGQHGSYFEGRDTTAVGFSAGTLTLTRTTGNLTVSLDGRYLPLAGGTLTGGLSGTTGSFSGQITSTVATGTAPFVVTSTTQVNNLNAQLLGGQLSTYYAAASSLASYLPLSGGQMTGALTLHSTGTNGFYNGTGDAATYALYNLKLGGWNGMALENLAPGGTYPSQVVGVIDFRSGTIDMKGGFKVSGASVITENQSITISGDASGSGKTAINLTLASVGTAGTYRSVTTDAKGRVTAGTNPTTLAGYGITDALPITGGTLTGLLNAGQGILAPGADINYAAADGWTAGTGDGVGYYGTNFAANGNTAAENTRSYKDTPYASPGLIWATTNNDATSDADGGWNKDINGLTANKSYRSIVWVRRSSASTNGQFYHGCSSGSTLNLDNTANTNPYFGNFTINTFTQSKWYLSVGYVHANNDGSTTSYGGLYDGETGQKVLNYTDFKMAAGAQAQTHRVYLYYSTDPAALLDFWGPRFEEVDGNEPSVGALLGFLPSPRFTGTPTVNGNTVIHAGNYTSYPDATKLPLTGGALTGTISIDTSGSTALVSSVIIKRSGQSALNFGQYTGQWRPALQIQSNASDRLLFLAPPESDFQFGLLRSANGGLKIDVGGTTANTGVNAITIDTAGTANFPVGLQQNGSAVLTAASTSAPNLSVGGSAGSVAWTGVTGKPTTLSGYGITDALPLSGGTLTGGLIGTSANFSGTFIQTGEALAVDACAIVHNSNVESYYQLSRRLQAFSHLGSTTTLEIEAVTLGGGNYNGEAQRTTWRISSRGALYVTRHDEHGGVGKVSLKILNDTAVPDANGQDAKYVVGLVCGNTTDFVMVWMRARFLQDSGTSRWVTIARLATATPSTVSGSAMTYSSGWIANTGFTNTSFTEVVPAGKFAALALTGVLTSTVATGTAPLVVASTTAVANLNSDLLDGQHGAYYQDAGNLNAGTILAARMPAYTGGDVTSPAGSVALTLANSGVTAGTYRSVTVDAKGRVTAGTNPTTLGGYGITDALPIGGGTLTGKLSINSTGAWNDAQALLTVGSGGDGRIQVRHIWGKSAANNNADHLWLNYQNANGHVQIGDSGGGNNLYVSGQLYAGGYFGGSLVLHAGNYGAYSTFTGTVTGTNFSGPGTGLTGTAASLTAGAVPWSGVTGKPTTLSGYGITDAMYQVDPNGFTQGDINGSGNMQRLWGTDSVQNLIAFRPPTTVEYTTDNVNWVATTISNDVFDGKVFGKWAGFNMNVGSNIGAWTKVRMTWVNFGYHFFSHFTLCHSTNGHSMNFVFYKSDLSGVFSSEAYRVNGISSWPGYTFTSHVNVSGWWDTRDVRMVFELNGNNGPSGYPNNAISIGHIGIMGGYSSFNRVFDWDGNRNITLFGNLTLPGNVSATGTVSGSSFSGAGTNLTGTANSLNVGGYSARWATGRTIALTGDVTGTSGAFDGTAALSFGVTIANSAVTYAKIQNVAAASVLGNSSASVAQAPAALSMATLAGMLSNQAMNINGSATSVPWSGVTGKPTTVTGYGITDAMKIFGAPGVDLNTLTTAGVYRISNTEANRPNDYGQLLVMYGGSDTITQIYGHYADGTLKTRSGNPTNVGGSGTYTAWRTLLADHNYSNYALPLSGGTLTGALTSNSKFETTANVIGGNFSGPGTGLTGTAASLTAGSANAIADGAVSTSAKIAASVVTYAKIQNVSVSTVLGNSSASVAQAPVEINMASLAGMLSNQTMNINGSSASCTGNAATATNGFTVKPVWAGAQNLIADLANFNNSVPSGFYQYSGATNSPTATWYNLINVRHSNTGNDHGFQLAMSYYDEVLWSRTYSGGTGANNGTFTTWRAHLHSGNYSSYALPLAGGTLTGALNSNSKIETTGNVIGGNFSGPGTGLTGTAASLSIGGNAATATSSPLLSALSNYVWSASTLPQGYNQGIQASFVSASQGFQNYGSLVTVNTYSAGGGALQLYVPYSPTYGGTGLQVRFGNYDVSSGNSWTSWKTLLASDNYTSYTLPLTGGTLTGALTATSFSGAGTGLTGTAASLSIGGSAGSVAASGITGQTGMWTSAARPGPYRLYRRDVNDAYSVQNYWTGTYWRLDGYYSNDTVHAGCSVAYADTAGSVSTIADGAVSTTAKLANSVVTYAKIQNVGASSVLGNTSASVSQAPQEITFANLGPYINGVARAWVTFNENPSTGAITINASLGISSVTRINYGQYRVNFSTAFADANYAVSGTIGYESNGGYLYGGFLNIPRVATPKTTTYCEVTASYGDGNTYNARFVHVVFDR
jgi:hypothetical protein